MLDADTLTALQSIADSLKRLADRYAPETQRERKPASLSTACYTREERERAEVRATLRGEKPQPKG